MPLLWALGPVKIWDANNKALALWVKATGFKPNVYDEHHDYHRSIQESQEVDPTALTTFLILRSTARAFAENLKFSGLEFLEHPESVLKKTAKIRELLGILKDPECQEEVERFKKDLREQAKTMGLLEVAGKVIDDEEALAYIRRDALRGWKGLKVHHFGFGTRGPHKPKYNENVIKFWNMNSVVAAARQQPMDGISMVMVRDPVELFSYFCFLVVNGENITVVSDLPDTPHPFHKYMSRARAQERRFEDRAYRLRFPYDLFNFEFADDARGHRVFRGEKKGTGVTAINTEAVIAKPIKDLEPDQAVWAMMMFDVIAQEYWNEPQKTVALSYTADGMRALGQQETSKSLIVPGQALVAPLTREDMRREKLTHVWESKPTGQHDWMEDRYANAVPEEIFNLIGTDKVHRLLSGPSIKPQPLVPKTKALEPVFNTSTVGWKNKNWILSSFEATLFGTPEQMESDRRFVARYNQAIVIEAAATKEYHARKHEVARWFEKRVKENLPALLKAAAEGKFMSEIQGTPPKGDDKKEPLSSFDNGVPQSGNLLWQCRSKSSPGWGRFQVQLYKTTYYKYLCYLTGAQVAIWTRFMPMTPKSVADLAGCKVAELPDVIQHWYRNDRYSGNQILDRIDPLEWKCENPWRAMRFDILLGLSQRSWKKIQKEYGVPYRHIEEEKDDR